MIIASIDKIEFALFGLDLLEPNAMLTDSILGILVLYFGFKISQLNSPHLFFKNWKRFLWTFGLSAIMGGIGHTFYNYFGLIGKTPAWFLGIIAVYFVEISMISIHPNSVTIRKLTTIARLKLILVLSLMLLILFFTAPGFSEKFCILIVVFNSLLGVFLSAGVLGYYYYRSGFSQHYAFLVLGVLIMIPSSIVFIFNVNLYQWFDKNDLSHLILGLGISFFYTGLLRLHRQVPAVLFLK